METVLQNLSQSIAENPFLAYLGVFLGGILSSSSPCVLATIPLVIGYVGGYSEGDRRKSLLYSLTFILGLSITFTILGAIASLVGGLFGMTNRAWYFVVGGIAIAVGLHLVGLYGLNIPLPVQPETAGDIRSISSGSYFWDRILSLRHSCPRPDSDFRSHKGGGRLWNFAIVHLCDRPLCTHLLGRGSNRLCSEFHQVQGDIQYHRMGQKDRWFDRRIRGSLFYLFRNHFLTRNAASRRRLRCA
jgi:hypothetical protein